MISGEAGLAQPGFTKGKNQPKKKVKKEEKKPIFEVLEDNTDYSSMIVSNKLVDNDSKIELKIHLEDYESIAGLNVDVSQKKVLITDPGLNSEIVFELDLD